MRKIQYILLMLVLVATPFVITAWAQAQGETMELRLRRDFGYGGGFQIQGAFTLLVKDDERFDRVVFYIDGQAVFDDSQAPFEYKFNTEQFEPGEHEMYAVGYLPDGVTVQSNRIIKQFLSAEEARGKTVKLIVPLIGILSLVTLLGVVLPLLFQRNKRHIPFKYGVAGGAVCPRCGLPFSRSLLAPNMLVGKLQRCPHCGKWSIVPRASMQALEEAERRLASEGSVEIEVSTEEERLRKMLDETRYDE